MRVIPGDDVDAVNGGKMIAAMVIFLAAPAR
jgi:hypothetical protein